MNGEPIPGRTRIRLQLEQLTASYEPGTGQITIAGVTLDRRQAAELAAFLEHFLEEPASRL